MFFFVASEAVVPIFDTYEEGEQETCASWASARIGGGLAFLGILAAGQLLLAML